MADEGFFLTKTTVGRETILDVGGSPVLERFPSLVEVVTRHAGRDAAGLFAEPVLSRGNGAAPTTISWYTRFAGHGVPLARLSSTNREAAERLLQQRLAGVAELLHDPIFGPMVGAALHQVGPDDVWVVDGQPVLLNWGLVPGDVGTSSDRRNAHFRATLGRFLPLSAAPPISGDEIRAAPTISPAISPAASAAPIAASAAVNGTLPPQPPPPSPQLMAAADGRGRSLWGWAPLVLLLLVAAGTLLYITRPGALLYPSAGRPATLDDATALRLGEEGNAVLEERIAALREAIQGAVCSDTGELLLPNGLTPRGTRPREAGATGPSEGRADALLPPSPGRLQVPPSATPATLPEPGSLVDLVERSTVLVVVRGPDGGGTGSGFFVSPDVVVTNDHVVAAGNEIFVVNRHLDGVRRATVVARRGPLEATGADFAVLRVHDAEPMPYFAIRNSRNSMKLQNVIAAGYPALLMETDAEFERLMRGDAGAIPESVFTQGTVNVEQRLGPETTIIAHTAAISPGNSGGPLVDSCARVVGVNTFGRERDGRTALFALHSSDLVRFLATAGIETATTDEACTPSVTPPPVAPNPVARAEDGEAERP